ncbi:MAG: class I SAM-dependent methyltransferase [Oscillospiraceae bacterium]
MSYGTFASYYDVLTENIDYHKRAEYFDKLIEKFGGNRNGILLDLACGTGSLTTEFVKLGYDVIGVDGSEEMLSVAIEKKYENNIDVLFLCQDMRNLDLFGTIDVSICALDSVNHITDLGDLEKIFDKISLFSNEHALFIFDANTIYKHKEILSDKTFVYDCEDVYCVWQNSSCGDNNEIEINLDFFEKEEDCYYRSEESFFERAYSVSELTDVLTKTGFEVLAIYGDDTEDEPKEDTQRLVFVAKLSELRNG